MRSKIVRIGNSRGVRLPKIMIEQAGLSEEVELRVEAGQIVIAAPRVARAGWAEAAQGAHAVGDDALESTVPRDSTRRSGSGGKVEGF